MKIIVFSTGRRMYEYMMRDAFKGMDIIAFCDNDTKKQGQKINGIEIIAPSEISHLKYDRIYIASDIYFDEIKEQLISEVNISAESVYSISVDEDKYTGEMSFWKAYYARGEFGKADYKQMMLNILDEVNDDCFADKVVADFGCGPQGTLSWTSKPRVKIGIDVLAEQYFETFPEELSNHGMIYVKSSETKIPLPTDYVDYLITINSLDHVFNLDVISKELKRILKKGGTLLAGFNLNEAPTECEPQKLTIRNLTEELLEDFVIQKCKVSIQGHELESDNLKEIEAEIGRKQTVLWLKAIKK